MRIKFLSVIVSFLLVSIGITSCLDSENNIEYSPDAIIQAFQLDTVRGLNNYAFTINQFGSEGMGLIYNEDSLPLGSDTIIDRILINIAPTSNVITSKNSAGEDTIMNLADSIDLRKPITIKMWSMQAIASNDLQGPKKEYRIQVNVHKQDPDSMNWAKVTPTYPNGSIVGEQKAVLLSNNIFVYSNGKTYKGSIADKGASISWQSVTSDLGALPGSLLNWNDTLFATANNKLYYSLNGENWLQHPNLTENIVTLTASFSNSISAVISHTDGKKYFAKAYEGQKEWEIGTEVPSSFPLTGLSSTTYITTTGNEQALLIGDQTGTNTTPWMSAPQNDGWADLSSTNAACPLLKSPSIIHYNGALYAFGGDFSTFYKSMAGLAWYKPDSKFWMPTDFKELIKTQNYSMVTDSYGFIWIMWANEVWRGRLNKLGFARQ